MAISILALLPSAKMRPAIELSAETHAEISLTIVSATYNKILQAANIAAQGAVYDYVIAAEPAASFLIDSAPELRIIKAAPVLKDFILLLKECFSITSRTAIVTIGDYTDSVDTLKNELGYQIDYFHEKEFKNVATRMQHIIGRYESVICDSPVYEIARRMGAHAFLLAPGTDVYNRIFDNINYFSVSTHSHTDESDFYQDLLVHQTSQIVVLRSDGSIFYSNSKDIPAELIKFLSGEYNDTILSGERHLRHNHAAASYTILAHSIRHGSEVFAAYNITKQLLKSASNIAGIRYFSTQELSEYMEQNPFIFTELNSTLYNHIMHLANSSSPIMITGEDGTGKPAVAARLCAWGPRSSNTYVLINIYQMQKRSWEFLLENPSSPLFMTGCTLYFSSLDTLVTEHREYSSRLLSKIMAYEVCRKNTVYISCIRREGETLSEIGTEFRYALNCITLHIPALRKQKDIIPQMISWYIDRYNASENKNVSITEPAVIGYLQNFKWPFNLTQFNRVMRDLAYNAANVESDSFITGLQTFTALEQERFPGIFYSMNDVETPPLNISRKLTEINKDVALHVVKELGGNRTAAARSLGISRTTLWRILNS